MKKVILLALGLCILIGCQIHKNSTDKHHFPKPNGIVNDFEGILSEEEEATLRSLISDYSKKTTNQICIVTTASIAPYSDVLSFATALSNEWGVGQKDKNNGLTIVVSSNLRSDAIATGLGTEKILTDYICRSIRGTFMIPEYKKGQYYEGLKKGVEEIIRLWGY